MGVETGTVARSAGDDGSGSPDFWEHIDRETYGISEYVMADVSKRTLGGAATTGAFAEDFHRDRQMPVRPAVHRLVTAATLGPENYLG